MQRIIALIICLSFAGAGADAAFAGRKKLRAHIVEKGQTLWIISRHYGCSVAELKQANGMTSTLLRPGQSLHIPACGGGSARVSQRAGSGETSLLIHHVASGDTLGWIAKRYDTSVDDIRGRNGLDGNLIRPGQKLRVAVGQGGQGRGIPGQSMGSPSRGSLVSGMQLPPGKGYFRRRPQRAWGANHTIHHIRQVVAIVRGRFPKLHDLAIGDISVRRGGPVAEHKSHQSGRDADIGLYFTRRPKGYPQSFIRADESTLHLAASFELLRAFADTAGSSSGVDKMFLSYELQEVFYKWGKQNGVAKRVLDRMFQYPDGELASKGIIRHEPGHDTHVHVRFKCPKSDKTCV